MGVARPVFVLLVVSGLSGVCLQAQTPGRLEGQVFLREANQALSDAEVLVVELGRQATTQEDGSYSFDDVPPGVYNVIAHINSVITEEAQVIEVRAGETATLNFTLELQALHHEITVTAEGQQLTAFESFQSVDSLD